jgi:hypothetical protein
LKTLAKAPAQPQSNLGFQYDLVVAPVLQFQSSSAENRGAILPDARTWQADTGIRYLVTPRVKLIAGVFEIEKPYFNLDSSDVDRALGLQRATGLELSASGEVIRNFNLAAAVLWGWPWGADTGLKYSEPRRRFVYRSKT